MVEGSTRITSTSVNHFPKLEEKCLLIWRHTRTNKITGNIYLIIESEGSVVFLYFHYQDFALPVFFPRQNQTQFSSSEKTFSELN